MKKCSKSYWPQLGLTLIIGASGGWLFTRLGTPLPWMLGALSATMVGSMVGLPLQVPQLFRRLWIIVLGVMLGSCFGPETLDHMVLWGGSFAGMIAFVTFTTLAVAWFYNRFGKFDRNTALFCATPGGLGEMAILGPALGADEKTIVLTHATRIVMVMACVPPAYALMEGYVPAPNLGSKGGLSDANLYDLAILGIAGFGGALLAKVLRLPAWQMCGSMFASAAIHAANITSATPPDSESAPTSGFGVDRPPITKGSPLSFTATPARASNPTSESIHSRYSSLLALSVNTCIPSLRALRDT